MVVPAGRPAGFTFMSFPPANSMRVPSASDSSRVSSSSRETAAIVGSASPRKPSVEMESKSSADFSLLVAWRSKASRCVVVDHAVAVVDDADHPLAADFGFDANRLRTSVERVFEQLFHYRGRTFDNFARSDFICDSFRQYAYSAHARVSIITANG